MKFRMTSTGRPCGEAMLLESSGSCCCFGTAFGGTTRYQYVRIPLPVLFLTTHQTTPTQPE
eukprot:6704541-Pyramimonas_sp.AAC.1